jgi:class 3 adenylate cyclase
VGETRKLAAILVSDVVGYSRLAGADEDRILARLRALRSDLIDPTIAVHHALVSDEPERTDFRDHPRGLPFVGDERGESGQQDRRLSDEVHQSASKPQ